VYACGHMTVKCAALIYICKNFKMCTTETGSKERRWVEMFNFLWKAGFILSAVQYLGSAARNFVFALKFVTSKFRIYLPNSHLNA
jgi:hypothetical protein